MHNDGDDHAHGHDDVRARGRDDAHVPHHGHDDAHARGRDDVHACLLYTSPSPRDGLLSRMPSSA